MKQIISVKNKKLSKEFNACMQNIEKCLEIANKVTEFICDASDKNIEKPIPSKQRHDTAIKNLDILTELFQKINQKIYKSYSKLDLAGNFYDVKHFTYPENDVDEYKVNDVGKCVITNIDSVAQHRCHIYNVEKPPLNCLKDVRGERFTMLPGSGKVFAIELGSDGLSRAVCNDFVNEGSESMHIQLIDTGENRCVRKDGQNLYELPKLIQDIKSRAMLCKVVEVVNEKGISLNIDDCMKILLGKRVAFKIVKIRNSILFIKITLISPNTIIKEELNSFQDDVVDLVSDEDVHVASNSEGMSSTETIDTNSLALQDITEFDIHNGLPECIFEGEFVEKVSEVRNMPSSQETATFENFAQETIPNDENTAIDKKQSKETEAYKMPKKTEQDTTRGETSHKDLTAPRTPASKKYENSVTTRVTLRTPIQRKIPLKFREYTCIRPSKRTLEMNRSSCKTDSANDRNKLEIDVNQPTTSKHSNNSKTYLEMHPKASTSVETNPKLNFKNKTKKVHHCEECGKSFDQKTNFIHHMMTHTGEKPYQCRFCGTCFSQKGNLVTHTRTHTGERPYVCSVCNEAYGQLTTLQNHHRIHTGDRPYSCALCGESFRSSWHFYYHKKHHK